jgi:phage portal protein BeeE
LLSDLIRKPKPEARDVSTPGPAGLSMPDYLRLWEIFGYNGIQYVIPGGNITEMTALQSQRDAIVAACVRARQMVFSEIRFCFQGWSAGRPGKLFGNPSLALLESPWPQASTSDLLSWMEVDGSLYGNSYWVLSPRPPGSDDTGLSQQFTRLDPSRVHIIHGDVLDDLTGKPYGKQLIGYGVYDRKNATVATFTPDEVCHFRPIPDPKHEFRGASWLASLLPDVIADLDMTDYMHSFISNAATPNLVIQFTDPIGKDAMTKFIDAMESHHTGPQGATKNLYVGSGVDVKAVGSNFQQITLVETLSHTETRIAAAAGVPPALLGIAEGLKGSALNAGNFASTRRAFADITIRPLWRTACAALSVLVPAPPGSRLWFDARDVHFLQADLQDAATQRQSDSVTMLNLVNAGFDPESVVAAIQSGDWTQLEHTGLLSVQLQPITDASAEAGTATPPPEPPDDEDQQP